MKLSKSFKNPFNNKILMKQVNEIVKKEKKT